MNTDLFTKVVLTIIAACLLYDIASPHLLPREADAQLTTEVVNVRIVGHQGLERRGAFGGGPIPVRVVSGGGGG